MAIIELASTSHDIIGKAHKTKITNQFNVIMAPINTPEEVKAAEQEPGAIFLDVRGADEVKAESLQARPFKHATCTLDDCSELMSKAETLLSDKNAPVIVFCRSGRRAGKAKEVLEQMGYTKVLNAGGLNDLRYL